MSDTILDYTATTSGNSATLTMHLEGNEEFIVSTDDFPPNVVAELLAYGLKQKYIDSVAARKTNEWTTEETLAKLTALRDSHKAGSFTMRSPGSTLTAKIEALRAKILKIDALPPEKLALLEDLGLGSAPLKTELRKLETKLAKTANKS